MGIEIWCSESFKEQKQTFFEQVASLRAEQAAGYRIILLVPEAAKLDIETDFLRSDSRQGMMQTQVLSFSRLCAQILEETGQNTLEYVDDTGQTMLVFRILREHEDEFPFLKNLCRKPRFVTEILSVMGELNRFLINAEKLAEAAQQIADPIVSRKADELSRLMMYYRSELLRLGLKDPQENYTLASAALANSGETLPWLKGCEVYVLGFGRERSFTPQELHLIEKLAAAGNVSVAVTAPCDDDCGKQELFFAGIDTLTRLKKINGCNEKPHIIPSGRKPVFAHLAECLCKQEAAAYQIRPDCFAQSDGTIRLMYAATRRQEAALVAGKIHTLIRENGLRYRDILVAVPDMAAFLPVIQAVFRRAQIPVYADDKKSLIKTPVGRMVRSLFDMVLHPDSNRYLIAYLRSGLSGTQRRQVDAFENFMLRKGIRSRRQRLDPKRYEEDPEQAIFRDQVFKGIVLFEEGVRKAAVPEEYCDALKQFLEHEGMRERTEQAIEELLESGEEDAATAMAKAWNQLMQLMVQIRQAGGNAPMDVRAFRDILMTGIENAYASAIPSCLDQVRLTSVRQLPVQSPKALFLMGMTAEDFPGKIPPEGILKDRDRETLSDIFRIPIPSMAADKLYEDQFLAFSLMTTPEDMLFISLAGQPGQETSAVRFAKTCFEGLDSSHYRSSPGPLDEQILSAESGTDLLAAHILGQSSDSAPDSREEEFIQAYKVFSQKDDLSRRLNSVLSIRKRKDSDIRLSQERIIERLGQPVRMSVSQLETFSECSYRYFCDYLISCHTRPEYRVEERDVGSMLHRVAQDCLGHFIEVCRRVRSGEELEEVIARFRTMDYEQYVNESLERIAVQDGKEIFLEKGIRASDFRRTSLLAGATLRSIFEQMDPQGFLPGELEWKFSDEKGNALRIDIPGLPGISFRGLIDRVDLCDHRFRVIDYKKGETPVNFERYYRGLSLQLFAYMAAYAAAHPEAVPEEAGYIVFDRPMALLENADIRQEENSSKVKLAKIRKIRGSSLDPDQLRAAGEFTVGKIKHLSAELLSGKVKALPATVASDKKLPCEYCDYRAVCGFEPHIDPPRVFAGLPHYESDDGKRVKKAKRFAEAIRNGKSSATQEKGGDG